MARFEIIQADITELSVDAIVNAANNSLLGGGGVDGAIHHAAGPELLTACKTLHGCATGQAKITKGYRLPARYVIHTVGPVWNGGGQNEEALLASCYREVMSLVQQYRFRSVAFPAISCGVYRFPLTRACAIAIATLQKAASGCPELDTVYLVCFNEETYQVYQQCLTKMET
jgi:O-acetyl-ADP-ribose deacetylase